MVLPSQGVDESTWILTAATAHNGAILWKQVSGCTGGPLIFKPLTVMLVLGDGLNYTIIRLFGMLFCILPSVFFIWRTFQRLYGETIARFISIGLFIYFACANDNDLVCYNAEYVPLLFISLSIFLLYGINNLSKPVSLIKIMLIGFLLGALPYAKLQSVPMGLAIGTITLIRIIWYKTGTPKIKLIIAALLLASALLPSLIAVIYLSINDAWYYFIHYYIEQNIVYANKGNINGCHVEGLKRIVLPIKMLGYSIAGIMMGSSYALMLISGFIISRTKINVLFSNILFRESALLFFAAYLAIYIPGNGFSHYQLFIIFPSALIAASVAKFFFNDNQSNNPRLIKLYGAILMLMCLLAFINTNRGILFVKNKGGYEIENTAKVLMQYTHPNEMMASWGYEQDAYVQSGLILAHKFPDPFIELNFPKETNHFFGEYADELATNKPPVFIDGTGNSAYMFTGQEYNHENYPAVAAYISENYRLIKEVDGKRVYISNERLVELNIDTSSN